MIDTLLQLLDRVIQLSKYRKSKVRTVFHELVQPLFEELLIVHANYIEMFEEATACLEDYLGPNSEQTVREVIDRLKQRRIEYEPVRTKLDAMAGAFFSASSELEQFGTALFYYFPKGYLSYNVRHHSTTFRVIEQLELLISKQKEEPLRLCMEALEIVDVALMAKREQWARVCEQYAKLKILSTSAV